MTTTTTSTRTTITTTPADTRDDHNHHHHHHQTELRPEQLNAENGNKNEDKQESAPSEKESAKAELDKSGSQAHQVQELQQRPSSAKGLETRKGSSVSFKDVCELFEIDLEAGGRPRKPPAVFSLRYYIMILALVSPFVVTYSKTIINFAITDMIDANYLNQQQQHANGRARTSDGSSTPATSQSSATLATSKDYDNFLQILSNDTQVGPAEAAAAAAETQAQDDGPYFELDNSCPVDETTRVRLQSDLQIDQTRARESQGEKFEWDTVKQGLLKAAYSIGHMLLQVAGGRLSEIHGSRLIMGLSSALVGACCLAAPLLASAHFYLLFADLLVLGILGSFMTPALITLFSNWLTPSEKSMMLSFYLVSSRLGYALSSLLCGLLIQAQLSWRYLFYSAGWISLLFSVAFCACARSRPHEHPLIKQQELDYLASKNTLVREALARSASSGGGGGGGKSLKRAAAFAMQANRLDAIKSISATATNTTNGEKLKTNSEASPHAAQRGVRQKAAGAPWAAIMTNGPVWAFIVTKFCVKLAGDTVQIELPTYLKRVMHLAPQHNGFVNASNYVIFCVSCLLVGTLAKTVNKRRPFGWSKTLVRKVFQFFASFGAGLCLLGISMCVCQETSTLALLMLFFFFTTFSTGGEAQIPLDISERYAGTIHALGSSLAISGAIEPILVGYLLKDYPADRDRWAGVWMGAGGVAFLGGLVFVLFGDASIQPFDELANSAERRSDDDDDKAKEEAEVKSGKQHAASGAPNGHASKVLKRGHVNETFQGEDEQTVAHAQAPATAAFKESVQI